MDFFSREAGQARRAWLNDKDRAVSQLMRRYLGPTGIPERLEALGGLLSYTDAGDMVEAADASRALWNDPSVQNAARFATAGAAMAVPFVGAKMMNDGVDVVGDAIASGADDAARFVRGEDGAFAGIRAKTADLDALRRAEDMTASGASRDDIWQDTGWFQGVDGKWRFEINDANSKFTPDVDAPTVGEVFSHDDLFRAYPELRGAPYSRTDETTWTGERAFSGLYDEGAVTIHSDLGSKGGRRVMLHELQHGIQDMEGFAPGGNPSQFVADDLIPLIEEADARQDMLLGQSWRASSPEEAARLRALSKEAGRQKVELRKRAAEYRHEEYRKLAGEVEARNVEARRDMSAAERAENPPFLSEDVPAQNQNIRRNGNATGIRQDIDADGALIPVFDDNLVSILNKYGLLGAMMGGGALSQMPQGEQQ